MMIIAIIIMIVIIMMIILITSIMIIHVINMIIVMMIMSANKKRRLKVAGNTFEFYFFCLFLLLLLLLTLLSSFTYSAWLRLMDKILRLSGFLSSTKQPYLKSDQFKNYWVLLLLFAQFLKNCVLFDLPSNSQRALLTDMKWIITVRVNKHIIFRNCIISFASRTVRHAARR